MLMFIILFICSCSVREEKHSRPRDPWAFRSVLDKKPRMLTIALDTACYVAYDLANCKIYKVWKGGVLMEGAAYTDKKMYSQLPGELHILIISKIHGV